LRKSKFRFTYVGKPILKSTNSIRNYSFAVSFFKANTFADWAAAASGLGLIFI